MTFYVMNIYPRVVVVADTTVLFQAEDGIRDLVRSRGLGDVYKRQARGQSRWRAGRNAGPIERTPSTAQHSHSTPGYDLSLIHI